MAQAHATLDRMSDRPVILAVDDEPEVLSAVQRDLRSKYSAEYRIMGATSGQEAIDTIKELAVRGTPLALIVADQRMPTVSGVDVECRVGNAIAHPGVATVARRPEPFRRYR